MAVVKIVTLGINWSRNNKAVVILKNRYGNQMVSIARVSKVRLTWDILLCIYEKVQVGNDQEKTQSEKNPHSKNRGGEKN